MAQQVLVLNATYEPINVCSLQRAVVLVLKNKAEVLERAARRLRSATASYAYPLVIRLVYFVRVPRHESRKISRRAVFARDG
jgi:5-methylcytosine-specific restriction endonuclease McrA